jgi:adenine-specific DNA-methyltransferase
MSIESDHHAVTDASAVTEKAEYYSEQLVTYIGNKRSLLAFIGQGIETARKRLARNKLVSFDVFSGSGIVARYMKSISSKLIVNDIEKYSEVINRCYLANAGALDLPGLKELYGSFKKKMSENPLRSGIFAEMYAPEDDGNIKADERVFYTRRNAMYLDTAREYIEEMPRDLRHFFLAPLLSEASVHANTSGVFKGFYKNAQTGRGQFGGNKEDALLRIRKDIELPFPIWSNHECEVEIHRGDSNKIADCVKGVDVAYLDPPYNQHPYGSNYFMLNLLVDYIRPKNVSEVSGIPADWNRSDYNKQRLAFDAFKDLVSKLDAKFLIISFNSEGFIASDDMLGFLETIGKTEKLETRYNTFRGSRNLGNRTIHVKEYLYLVEKK